MTIKINVKYNGNTALHYIRIYGNSYIFERLIQMDADINPKGDEDTKN